LDHANTILHIRLINGDQITARFHSDDIDTDTLILEYPMLIEEKDVNGVPAVNLVKYLPFTAENEQVLLLKKDHILAISPVTNEFCTYYYNTIHYNIVFVQPHQDTNMKKINANLKTVLSQDNQDFLDAMKKHQDKIPGNLSEKMH
jgi:hypothetical protein